MIEIERLLISNNIKYDTLVPIINEAFMGSTADTVNLYVDMYSIFKVLYSNIDIKLGEYNNIVSCLVNIASHYRSFFKTRYNVYTNIYFVYSKNTPYLNTKFISKYNIDYIYKFNNKKIITQYINDNLDMFKLLVQYLPNMYFIESEFETGVAIYDLMCRTDIDNERGHVILTKDIYNFQLANMKPQTIVIRSKRDDSYYINKNNVLQMYSKERRVKSISKYMAPDLLTVLMALTSVKERNINTLFNITKAINILDTAIKNNRIINGYNSDVEYLWDNIHDSSFPVGYTTFESRFKSIDILFQHSIYINTPECINIYKSLVDKYDPETVKSINNKYFKTNPLDLNRL